MSNSEMPPEALFNGDPDAFVFYVLADKQVAKCKQVKDLPYHKQRSSYISAGVYSPSQKKVSFWGDALEINTCMEVLTESKTIDKDATYQLAGGQKISAGPSHASQVKSAVNGITRKGHAGFNRLPAKGIGKLQPQPGATASRPNVEQRKMPDAKTSGVVLPTPSGKIEIRTNTSKDLRQQSVTKRVTPRNI